MKNLRYSGLLALGLIISIFVGCTSSPQKQSEDLFEKGIAQLDEYKYDAAINTFLKIEDANPGSPLSLYGEALTNEKKMQYIEALYLYKLLAEKDTTFALAHLGIYRMMKFFDLDLMASQAAFNFVQAVPESIDRIRIQSKILLDANRGKEALSKIVNNKSLNDYPGEKHILTAIAFHQLNKFDSAQIEIDQGLTKADNTPEYFSSLADYFELIGLIDSSMFYSSLSINESGNKFDYIKDHFFRSLRVNYHEEARLTIRSLKDGGAGDLVTSIFEVHYYVSNGLLQYARIASDKVRLSGAGDFSKTYYDAYSRAKLNDETSVRDALKYTLSLLSRDNYPEEFKAFINYVFVMIYSELEDPVRSLLEFDYLPPFYKSIKRTKLREIFLYFNSNQIEEGTNLLEKVHGQYSHQTDWLTGLADIYGHQVVRQYDKAKKIYYEVLELDEWNKPAFTNLIEMYHQAKWYDDIFEQFNKFPYFEKRYKDLALLKAICQVEAGSVSEGVKNFKDNILPLKSNLTLFDAVLSSLNKQNRLDELNELYSLMVSLNPENISAMIMAADFYASEKIFDKCFEVSSAAYKAEPQNKNVIPRYAYALKTQGKTEEALTLLTDLLKRDMQNVYANFYISKIMTEEQIDLNRAANHARTAVALSNNDFDVWTNLCEVYFVFERFDLCRGEGLKQSRKYRDMPQPFYWIGMSLYKKGFPEAKEQLQRAIKNGLRGEKLKIANEIINKI